MTISGMPDNVYVPVWAIKGLGIILMIIGIYQLSSGFLKVRQLQKQTNVQLLKAGFQEMSYLRTLYHIVVLAFTSSTKRTDK